MNRRREPFFKFLSTCVTICVTSATLCGCGIIPDAFPLLGHKEKKALFTAVIRGVQCEIRRAVMEQLDDPVYGGRVAWLKDWSALINLQLTFDEALAFNPGVTLKTPNLPDAIVWRADGTTRTLPQLYNFGVGGRLDGDRSRTETIEYFYPFDNFVNRNEREDRELPCYHAQSFYIVGDLKLRDWLDDVLEPFKQCAFVGSAGAGRSGALVGIGEGASGESSCNEEELRELGKGKDNPIKIFAHNVSFRLTIGASASPSWNFVRIDAPLSAALFNVNRTDTSTLIITLGSASTKEVIARREKERPKVKLVRTPSREMDDNQAALRIGAAVANANAAMVLPR